MNKSIIKSSSHFHFIECKGAETLTVIFAARNDRPPKFTFWKTGNALDSHVILLNSDVPQWYRTGIPGIQGGIRGAIKSILDFKREVGAKRLVMTGSSMGAYAALLYGSMAGADQVLAFGVEPILGVPGGKTDITRNQFQYIYPDLTSLSLPPTTVYYGGMDINDVFGAWLLRKRKSAEIICIKESQHDTPDFLSRKQRLDIVLNDMIQGKKINTFEYSAGDANDDSIVNFLWGLNNPLVEKNWSEISKRINSQPKIAQKSTLVKYIHGISSFRKHDFQHALELLKQVTSDAPGFWEAWLNLGAVNLKLGNFEEAIKACWNSVKLRPHGSITHFQLSHVYEKAGMTEHAFEHAEWACKLNTSRADYFDYLAKIATIVKRPVAEKTTFELTHETNVRAAKEKFSDFDLKFS